MAHIHQVFDSDAHFSADPITKTLKNESSQKTTVIQKDHNSERFTFEIPRMIEGHDMSLCNDVKVHYINIDASTKQENKGVYVVDDLQISPEDDQVVICSWLVSGNATQLKGPLSFSISYSCVTDDLDYCLNTAAYKAISVAEGVYCGDYVAEEYADILVKWEQELVNAGGVTDEQVQEALNAYLAEHGITENDPTVPAWAKAPNKPSYTADEVGAISSTGRNVQNANLAFGAVTTGIIADKAVTAEKIADGVIPDAYTKAEVDELLEGIGTGGGGGGGGEAAWNTICEGYIPEAVASLVINADANGTPLANLDVNELLIFGHVKLSADSKLRFEHNGKWTSGNYKETTDKCGAWLDAYCVHQRKTESGIITVISISDECITMYAHKDGFDAYPIKGFEIHVATDGVTFTTDKTIVNAYYR